jgi:hypothetical protein
MGTGGTIRVCSPRRHALYQDGSGSFGYKELCDAPRGARGWARPGGAEKGINAAKRLAVSTGQLRQLPAVHLRPIDLVVFQEPSFRRTGDLVLRGVSRLDAFSVYPGRT